jgi:hypothetical protein
MTNQKREIKFSVTKAGQIQAFEYKRNQARWMRLKLSDAETAVANGEAKVYEPRANNIY